MAVVAAPDALVEIVPRVWLLRLVAEVCPEWKDWWVWASAPPVEPAAPVVFLMKFCVPLRFLVPFEPLHATQPEGTVVSFLIAMQPGKAG
jgi:hypothetical protein